MLRWRIFMSLQLFCLLHAFSYPGIISAMDEGSFLWAPKKVESITPNKKNMLKNGRWTRSIFNWLHSPLINSIQEAFVIDSVYENLVPLTRCIKRSISKSRNDLNAEKRFENEFFLWEDNEGNPLEFAIKQIQALKPNQQSHDSVYNGSSDNKSSFWEEPLFYEDNRDVNDVDINHLSYHEQLKLNDILKNKMHSALNHIFPHMYASTKKSKYYTLSPWTTKNVSVTNQFNLTGDLETKKSKREISHGIININKVNGLMKPTEISIAFDKVSALDILNQSLHENVTDFQDLFMESGTSNKSTVFNNSIDIFNTQKLKHISFLLDHLRDSTTENLIKDEKSEQLWRNDMKDNHNELLKSAAQKSFIRDGKIHRNSKSTHIKKFIKYKRKVKKKRFKFKHSKGHSGNMNHSMQT